MHFWIVRFEDGVIGVDNESVSPVNLTPLPANVNYFHWKTDSGEIHYSDRASLPERIADPIPYLWTIDQFLTLAQTKSPPLILPQAKVVKCDAADAVFHGRRQVPISYLGHDWDATDEEVLAMNNQLSYGGIGTGQSNQASLVSQINANVGSLASQINANVGSLKDQTNTNVGSLKDQVNADIVYQNENTLVPRINTALTSNKSLANATLNDRIGTASQPDTVNLDTINRGIVWNVNFPSPAAYVSQVNDASHPSAQVSSSGSVYVSFINVSFTNVSFTPVNAPSAAANIPWYPIDETNPVTLTFQQMSDLLAAINTRRANLDITRHAKKAAINACVTIAQVIAIDLTTGWP